VTTIQIAYSWQLDDYDALYRAWCKHVPATERTEYPDRASEPPAAMMLDQIIERVMPDYTGWGLDEWSTDNRSEHEHLTLN
jgi:hypothetical protein